MATQSAFELHGPEGVLGELSGALVHELEYLLQKLALGVRGGPSRQFCRHAIHKTDRAPGVGNHHCVADAGKSRLEQLARFLDMPCKLFAFENHRIDGRSHSEEQENEPDTTHQDDDSGAIGVQVHCLSGLVEPGLFAGDQNGAGGPHFVHRESAFTCAHDGHGGVVALLIPDFNGSFQFRQPVIHE